MALSGANRCPLACQQLTDNRTRCATVSFVGPDPNRPFTLTGANFFEQPPRRVTNVTCAALIHKRAGAALAMSLSAELSGNHLLAYLLAHLFSNLR